MLELEKKMRLALEFFLAIPEYRKIITQMYGPNKDIFKQTGSLKIYLPYIVFYIVIGLCAPEKNI